MLVALEPLSSLACPELPGAHRIFGGICWGLRAVCGEPDLAAFLDLCAAGDPPALLSSGFPWVKAAGKRIEFLPSPMAVPGAADAKWLSRNLWTALVGDPFGGAPTFAPQAAGVGGSAAVSAEELPAGTLLRFPKAETVRRRGGSGTHGRVEIAFPAGSGWWFLAHLRKLEWADRLRGAIRWVCDTGWGADRSAGKGVARARFETNPLPADETAASGRFVTLSAYHPKAAERGQIAAGLNQAEYALLHRDGLANPGRPLLMAREGSVLPRPSGTVLGECPVVSAAGESPARHWGVAYPIAMRT